MLLEQHLIQLFGNLPYLPKTRIVKHLGHLDVIKLSLISQDWNEPLNSLKLPEKRFLSVSLYTIQNSTRIDVSAGEGLSVEFVPGPMKVVLKNIGLLTICTENLQQDTIKAFQSIRGVLKGQKEAKIERVYINFDVGHEFGLDFLELLCSGISTEVIQELSLTGNRLVDGERLTEILKNVKIGHLIFKIKTLQEFQEYPKFLGLEILEMDDAKWITGEMWREKFACYTALLKQCRVTSRDINKMLKDWQTGDYDQLDTLELHLDPNTDAIDMNQVLEGLDAKPWDPKVRARFNLPVYPPYLHYDLSNGFDIIHEDEHWREGVRSVATVKLIGNVLIIAVWFQCFPDIDTDCVLKMDCLLKRKLDEANRKLEEKKRRGVRDTVLMEARDKMSRAWKLAGLNRRKANKIKK